jgi:hypothetical protein
VPGWKELAAAVPGLPRAEEAAGLAALGSAVAHLTATRGPQVAAQGLATGMDALAAAVAELDRARLPDGVALAGVAGFINLAQCSGAPLAAHPAAVTRWLAKLKPMAKMIPEPSRTSLAFAAIAYGQWDLVPVLTGAAPEAAFQPLRKFGFDTAGFLRYVAKGLQREGSLAALTPAWEDFVRAFPFKLGQKALTWPDLFSAGRAVLARAGGKPLEGVAAMVQAAVAREAARE